MTDEHGSLLRHTSTADKALLQSYLRLIQVSGIGPTNIIASCQKLDCKLSELCQSTEQDLLPLGWSKEQVKELNGPCNAFEHVNAWLVSSSSNSIVCFDSDAYPSLLRQISQPPLLLFCTGDIRLLHYPMLAIVGSRRVSPDARVNTSQIITELSVHSNLAIVSGLAVGVDGIAHAKALETGLKTIAVLGCGVDLVYPNRHRDLYQSIKKNGLIISEFLPGTKPLPYYFPQRNRIISGLALGTLVTEARIKSGSLVTANYAIEQNREVFAVPSNIRNPNAQGPHWLIKQGANLVESGKDILEVLGDKYTKQHTLNGISQQTTKKANQSLASDKLLDSVGYESTPVDLIAQRTGISISDLLGQLLEYELRGLVASTSEGYVKLGG